MKTNSWVVRVVVIIALLACDIFFLAKEYQKNNRLPFRFTTSLEEKLAEVLPLPSPAPTPLEQKVEFSEGQWVGSIVYGKVTNHNDVAIIYPEVYFSLSNSKQGDDYAASFIATVAAKLDPQKSAYFSQRFSNVPADAFWWSASIAHVASYSGQTVGKAPKGQQVSQKPIRPPVVAPTPADTTPWGVAKQLDDVTWTIKLGQDDRMATPQETLQALNTYRQTHGSGALTWDDNLAAFATTRAKYLNSIQNTDEHKGFKDYVSNEDNLKKLGFWSVGENSGYGHKLIGVHLIEWVYAADPAHNENQLNKEWSHVGIGIEGLAVVFIFGGNKM